jgi:hypothetical protein
MVDVFINKKLERKFSTIPQAIDYINKQSITIDGKQGLCYIDFINNGVPIRMSRSNYMVGNSFKVEIL